MNTDCVNCKHARLWTDKEKYEYIESMYKSLGRMPCMADHYICDKVPKGAEWTENGKTYTYDGYSLDGENYDEVFHCFESQESEEYIEQRLKNYNKLLKSGVLDCVMEKPQESEDKSCDNCKWNKTEKCQPSTCAMIGCDGHGLWEMIESEDT